jgi:intracellular septation protein
MTQTDDPQISQGKKMALDFLPLAGFFAAYKLGGMYWATGILMALTLAALLAGYRITGKIAKFPLYSAILVGLLGGATLILHNDTFFKMKPTVANLVFAMVLGGGLLSGRMFLKDLLGSTVNMAETAWRTMTWRWTIFFLGLAGLNEYVWRTMPEPTWVNFKVFGLLGLIVLFTLANAPFMAKHMIEEEPSTEEKPSANG